MVLILVSHFFALVFGLKNITIPIIDIHTELSTIAFVVCISIETFSIFENLKRSGFDIAKEVKKVVNGLLSIVKYFQNTKTKIGKL
jgi:phage-related holin